MLHPQAPDAQVPVERRRRPLPTRGADRAGIALRPATQRPPEGLKQGIHQFVTRRNGWGVRHAALILTDRKSALPITVRGTAGIITVTRPSMKSQRSFGGVRASSGGLIPIGSGAGGSSLGSPGTPRRLNSIRSPCGGCLKAKRCKASDRRSGATRPASRGSGGTRERRGTRPNPCDTAFSGGHACGGLRSIRSSAIRSGRPAIPRRCSAASMSSCLG